MIVIISFLNDDTTTGPEVTPLVRSVLIGERFGINHPGSQCGNPGLVAPGPDKGIGARDGHGSR